MKGIMQPAMKSVRLPLLNAAAANAALYPACGWNYVCHAPGSLHCICNPRFQNVDEIMALNPAIQPSLHVYSAKFSGLKIELLFFYIIVFLFCYVCEWAFFYKLRQSAN